MMCDCFKFFVVFSSWGFSEWLLLILFICAALVIITFLICKTIKEINEQNNSHEVLLHKQNVDDAKRYILLHEKCKYEKNCRKRK